MAIDSAAMNSDALVSTILKSNAVLRHVRGTTMKLDKTKFQAMASNQSTVLDALPHGSMQAFRFDGRKSFRMALPLLAKNPNLRLLVLTGFQYVHIVSIKKLGSLLL